jgi:hypothetical protein
VYWRTVVSGWWLRAAVLVHVALVVGCTSTGRESAISAKLRRTVDADLAMFVGELPPESRRDSLYHEVVSYESGLPGRYSAKAVVDLHYLKGVRVKMVCKYRFVTTEGKWEGYAKEWRFTNDSTQVR